LDISNFATKQGLRWTTRLGRMRRAGLSEPLRARLVPADPGGIPVLSPGDVSHGKIWHRRAQLAIWRSTRKDLPALSTLFPGSSFHDSIGTSGRNSPLARPVDLSVQTYRDDAMLDRVGPVGCRARPPRRRRGASLLWRRTLRSLPPPPPVSTQPPPPACTSLPRYDTHPAPSKTACI
jgi:hypothetical protein